jgi:ABC-type sugar transport system ATPase subunit
MPAIELQGVTNFILDNVNLKIMDKELLVLLGPTGAGKTTILNTIAGLIPYQGSILIDGQPVEGVPTHKRRIGYFFQNPALFPHLDVFSNIAYSLKIKKFPAEELKKKMRELLQLMQIEHLAHRYPKDLSGGEKHRVALARVLASSPRILLLDEPLVSTDMRFSKYFQMELRRLQKQLEITTLYVTHDFIEAEEMGDRIALVYGGRIEQVGTYQEVFFSPKNKNVSRFVGEQNIFSCDYSKPLGNGLVEVGIRGLAIVVHHQEGKVSKIAIPSGHIGVYNDSPRSKINNFKGKLIEMRPLDTFLQLKVKIGEVVFLVEMQKSVGEEMGLNVGKEIFIVLKLPWIKVLNGG